MLRGGCGKVGNRMEGLGGFPSIAGGWRVVGEFGG